MKQLKVGTNELLSVAKKKVTAAATLVSSTEAFSTVGLALQLEVPMAVAVSIPGRKVWEECWNSGLDGRLEVLAASIQLEATVVAPCWRLPDCGRPSPQHHGCWVRMRTL
jgi:hypothetical protein